MAWSEQVFREGRQAQGIVPLLRLWRAYPSVRPAFLKERLEAIAHDQRLLPAIRLYAQQLLGRLALRMGDLEGSRQTFEALGYIRTWRVIGPFDNEGKAGFAREEAPERQQMEAPDLDAEYQGAMRPVRWRVMPEVGHYGYVSFDALFYPDTNVCAYAETFVLAERTRPLTLWLGAGGAIAVWWNGVEVFRDDHYRQPDPDRFVVVLGAHAGPNRLLVKVCTTEMTWGFYARLADEHGEPAKDLRIVLDADFKGLRKGHSLARLPSPPVAPLEALERAARGPRPNPQALENLALYLLFSGADDPAEGRAKDLARRAAEAAPTVERLLLAADLASGRSEATAWLERALRLAPEHPKALLAWARFVASGPAREEALRIIERIPEGTTSAIYALEIKANLYEAMGMKQSVRAIYRQALERTARAPEWVERHAWATQEAGAREEAYQLFQEVLRIRFDQRAIREQLIEEALARGDREVIWRELEAYRRLYDDIPGAMVQLAAWYEALGQEDLAMATYRRAIEVRPDHPQNHVAYARALLRAGRRDLALEALRHALELSPQEVAARELLELIEPEERIDEAYATPQEEFLDRLSQESGYPFVVLEDLTVNTVYENGLGSRFRQFVARVLDEEGARALRTHVVPFDPEVQRVSLRMARVYRNNRIIESARTTEHMVGEGPYRIYYDMREFVITLPNLEPGDVVELRYRIDDVAERNRFHDYFGDLHFFQGAVPIERMRYILIGPKNKQFYFHRPKISHEFKEQIQGDHKVYTFIADRISALHPEEGMPGPTETRPYLHLSTYQNWEEVGRWWWGLIRDQLEADERIKEKVREITKDATDIRTKVQRIYRWVIDHTRYVGLEFGIHGYKPYRVTQVVERGFGDCKDKASLLYVMLKEAGIDAHLVLVRTRDNGAIHEFPASLSAFDHAIAYVPAFDLYLDGTAEMNGTNELPRMDQGVMVLHVWPGGSALRRTPVLPPERNTHHRVLDVELDSRGRGHIQAVESVRGDEAAQWRSSYQAEATRRDRFERMLQKVFPGLSLESLAIEGLHDYEVPPTARYRAIVPRFATDDPEGRLRVPVAALGELLRTMARTEQRIHPLDLGVTLRFLEERLIRWQGKWALEEPLENVRLESAFGKYERKVAREGDFVRVTTELVIARDRIEPSEYPSFRSFLQRVDAALRQRLVLRPLR
ncbi:MAG: DUF3857 domain-containing protein [Sandaracinaceae bacterium]|nr:DUF3857 domain-containing protein [Sandaracinaceae bacterium]